jgi:two-component system chemotaxis response regulator CheY
LPEFATPQQEAVMGSIDMSALSILVADSNHYMRKILRTMLRGFGISKIREADNGAKALEELNTHLIDLVVADYALETLNGVEMTELVRGGEDSPNRYVPIIMLSAYTEKWRIEAARDAGVTEFLAKPLCAQDLYLRLIEVIERPRKFVRTARYFGPDRRRHAVANFTGPLRRESDKELAESSPGEQLAIDGDLTEAELETAKTENAKDLADQLFG